MSIYMDALGLVDGVTSERPRAEVGPSDSDVSGDMHVHGLWVYGSASSAAAALFLAWRSCSWRPNGRVRGSEKPRTWLFSKENPVRLEVHKSMLRSAT